MVKHDEVYQDREDASRAATARMMTRLGVAIDSIDRFVSETPDDEHYIRQIQIKIRYDDVGDVLLLAKAECSSGKVIAFQSGDTIATALLGLANRLSNGTVVWREDKPYAERNNNGRAGGGSPAGE